MSRLMVKVATGTGVHIYVSVLTLAHTQVANVCALPRMLIIRLRNLTQIRETQPAERRTTQAAVLR